MTPDFLTVVLADYADARVPYVTDNPDIPVRFTLTTQAEAELDTWTGPAPDPRELAAAREAWARPAMDPEPDLDTEAAELQAEADAEANAPEWDDAESSAYVARVEAGLEPEAGQ
jgi:hypothetical protein